MRRILMLLAVSAAVYASNPDGYCEITTPSVLPRAVEGVPYTITIQTTGCSTPPFRRFEMATGGLPLGLDFERNGLTSVKIIGTPTVAGTYAFSIRVIDADYFMPSKAFVLKIEAPVRFLTPAANSGQSGTAFSQAFQVTGGVAPYTFSLAGSTTLPSGLTLTGATGVVSGTLGSSSGTFRLRATDSNGNIAERSYSIFSLSAQVTTSSLSNGTVGTPYTGEIDSNLSSDSFSLALGSLPPGLSISSAGTVTGTPTLAGDYHFTLRSTSGTESVWKSFNVKISGAGSITGTPRGAEERAAYEHVFQTIGGVAPYTYAVTSGSPPSGISLDSTGVLYGELVPNEVNPSPFDIQSTDATGRTFSTTVTLERFLSLGGFEYFFPETTRVGATTNINSPYILYSGSGTVQYRLIGGTGREYLTAFNSATGSSIFAPTSSGDFVPVVLATDSLGGSVLFRDTAFTAVGPLEITTNAVPNGVSGAAQAYSFNLSSANAIGITTWDVQSGTLPADYSLSSSGVLSGPSSAPISPLTRFTVIATDSSGQSVTKQFSMAVGMFHRIEQTTLPAPTAGTPYSTQLTFSGSPPTAPNSWSVTEGNPGTCGLALSTTGVLAGTPLAGTTCTFTVNWGAGQSGADFKEFTIYVRNPVSATITPSSTLEATVDFLAGTDIGGINVSGGRAPYSFSFSAFGAPPDAYTLSKERNVISGSPGRPGTATFSIFVIDADGRTSANIPVTVNAREFPLFGAPPPNPTRTVPYSQSLIVTGGRAPYTFSPGGGSLPPGLSMSSAGVISGTPTTNGSFSFTPVLTDADGRSNETSISLVVSDPLAETSPAALPAGMLLSAYSTQLAVAGGRLPYTATITSGDVPPLLGLSNAGAIANPPLRLGSYDFTVQMKDADGRTTSVPHSILVQPQAGFEFTITTATLPNGTVGTVYPSQTIETINGMPSISFTISSGALPPGIELNGNTGVLAGTPSGAGTYNFTVQAMDGAMQIDTQAYTIIVSNPLSITTATLPQGQVGNAYNSTVETAGGRAPLAFTAQGLPANLTINASTGAITGSPTNFGSSTVDISVTDADNRSASRQYTLVVTTTIQISPSSLSAATEGTPYSVTLTSNPPGASWSVTSGALPTGLSLGPTSGTISGTPTVPGTFNFDITAAIVGAGTGTASYTLVVNPNLVIAPATLSAGRVGVSYSTTFTAPGGTNLVWTVSAGTLPDGLTLSSGGVLSGTPTAAGTSNFTINTTGTNGSAQATYDLLIQPPIVISPSTLPSGFAGSSYSATFTATGSTGFSWSVSSGSLPAGLTLSSGGVLSGTPTTAGTTNFTVSAESSGGTGQTAYTLVINAPITIAPATLPVGTVSSSYSVQLTASAGSGHVWSVSSGSLPAGITLSSGGLLSGTPTTAATSSFVVSAVLANASAQASYSLTVNPNLVISPATLSAGRVGVSYSATFTAPGGTGLVWTVSAGTLPAGLTLSSGGVLSGTPTTAGTSNFTINTTGTNGSAQATYDLLIQPPIVISPATLPSGLAGTSYSATFTATGSTGFSWSVSSGSLPAGLTLSSSGALSGTPSVAGTFNFTVSAESSGGTGQASYSLVINATISPSSLPAGTAETAYSQTFTATGGTGFLWSVTSGSLPPGLTLSSGGVLSGTPSVGGTSNFEITATSGEATGRASYSLVINALINVSPGVLPTGTVGSAYSPVQLTASSGTGYSWSVFSGSLPAGITLSSAGVFSGTPSVAGTSNFIVRGVSSNGTAQASYSLTVNPNLVISPATLSAGRVGVSYSVTFTAPGGTGLVWTVSAGTLPAGLTLSSGGVLSGTPTTAGTSNFTINTTGTNGSAQATYDLLIQPPIVISPATLSSGMVGTAYSATFTATGSTGFSWSVTAGSLPAGLTLSSSGVLSGTPTTAGTANFTISAESSGGTGQTSYSLVINPAIVISPSSLPPGTANSPYSATFTATGGTGFTWSVSSGSLPPGLTLSSGGVLSGTPSVGGTSNFTVRATSSGGTGQASYTLVINAPISVSPPVLPNGLISSAYSVQLAASIGTGYVWSVSTGSLPTGITLSSTGLISGTPTAPGTFDFIVSATSANGSAQASYSLTVDAPIIISPAEIPSGTVGVPYSVTFTASGETQYTWLLESGTLPPGLALSSAGVLSGTPTVSGTSQFTILAMSDQAEAEASYVLVINAPITVIPPVLPSGTVGSPYSVQLTTSAGSGFVWSVSSGSLPAGITLNSSGLISGTPATPGTASFVVSAESANGSAQASYNLVINSPITISPPSLPPGTVGLPYSAQLTTNSGTGFVWSVSAGSLPIGITLSSAGLLSGVPAQAGVFNFSVTASGTFGTAQANYSLSIVIPFTLTPPTLPSGTAGTPYSAQIAVTPATSATLSWSILSGSLPPGLSIGAATGLIAGTPITPGAFTFTVGAAGAGVAVQGAYAIAIIAPLTISDAVFPEAAENEVFPPTAFTAAGGSGSGYQWAVAQGTLPPGLTLLSNGILSGTATTRGIYAFTVRVTDSLANTATRVFSIQILPGLAIATASLGEAPQGRPYSATLVASGGRAPYRWSSLTAFPTGLTLTAEGVISGTTAAPVGPYQQTLVLTDARNQTVTRVVPLQVVVAPPPTLTMGPESLPNGAVGQPYSAAFSASGGVPGYSFSVVQGNLPPGLSLIGGAISGTPTAEGAYRFGINVSDSSGRATGLLYSVTISAAITPLVLTPDTIAPTAPIGEPYSVQFGATGGKAPYSFSLSGTPPPGVGFNSNGSLAGTPSQTGSYSFSVEVTDSLGSKDAKSYSVTIQGSLVITTQGPLADGVVGSPYSTSFGASGGRQPYVWTSSGNPPPGLSFDAAGPTLSGTPSTAGSFSITVEVRDALRQTVSQSYGIRIFDRLQITNAPAATPIPTGQPYSFTFATTGGKPAISIGLVSGNLPPGLSMSSTGEISGTPTTTGAYPFGVEATDALGNKATQSASITVSPGITITTTSLPNGTVGVAYSASLGYSGGVQPIGSWSISEGSLPAGLSLSSTGEISGTPTAAAGAGFTVRISDAAGSVATRALSITVVQAQLPPVTINLPNVLPPGQQSTVTLTISEPYTSPISGTITMTFAPNAQNSTDDPAVQFSSGGRTVTFTIPAGQTAATFPINPLLLVTGTTAGTIRLQTATTPPSATPVPDTLVEISRTPPVISSGTAQIGTGTFTLILNGYSNTREVSSGVFRLNPVPGATLQTTEIPVSLGPQFTTWYQSAASAPFGGQFTLTLPFTVSGDVADIDSVVVTLTNAAGNSQPFTVRLR